MTSPIAERVQDRNRTNRQDRLFGDTTNKVSFDKKIDDWIPKIMGLSLDKSGQNWSDLKKLGGSEIKWPLIQPAHRAE